MKKFLALVIALIMLCSTLASCGKESAESMLKKATAELENAPYNTTIKMNFETDNEELNSILSMMNIEVPASVNGKNISMNMSMTFMDYPITAKIIVADMIMYYDMEMLGQNIKMKATMNDEQYEEFMGSSNTEMAVDYEDFATMTVEEKDGKKYITCGGISDEGLNALNDLMAESLAGSAENVNVDTISYNMTLNSGKYESMDLSCTYSMTVDGESFTVKLDMGMTFSYDNVPEITAPADADAYEEMDYSDIMG